MPRHIQVQKRTGKKINGVHLCLVEAVETLSFIQKINRAKCFVSPRADLRNINS
jgi:hypothetical protein